MPNNYILTSDGSFISEDEYLQHWAIKKGEERPGHKYISRHWENGHWAYTYSQPVALGNTSVKNISEKSTGQNYTVSNNTGKTTSKKQSLKEYVNKLLDDIDMSSASEKLYYILHPKEKKKYEERKKHEHFRTNN